MSPFWGIKVKEDPQQLQIKMPTTTLTENNSFLNTVYELSAQGKEDYAIDVIFEYIDNLLIEGQFEDCDRILSEVAIDRIPPVLMMSFLTITAAAKSKLKNRYGFFSIIQGLLMQQFGEKVAQRLLNGIE